MIPPITPNSNVDDAEEPVPHHEEVRHSFEAEMDALRRDTVHLGTLVVENARRSAEAIHENDLGLAEEVVAADGEIDQRATNLERQLFEVMARQQPVAGDLRFLVSSTRMVYELERTGDLVVNCADALLRNEGFELSAASRGLLDRTAREAADILAKSLDCLADLDAETGAALEDDDDVVDEIVGEFFAGLGKESENHGLETAIQLSRVGRYLERIADHAVNIAEHVTFIVTGAFPEESHPPHPAPDEG